MEAKGDLVGVLRELADIARKMKEEMGPLEGLVQMTRAEESDGSPAGLKCDEILEQQDQRAGLLLAGLERMIELLRPAE